jgi:cytochrome c oxidase assembly protein subunit 11
MKRLDPNTRVLVSCLGVVALMLVLSFAAAPLYATFCRLTGFGGTPQLVDGPPDRVLDRVITIRFDANVAPGLDWSFVPVQRRLEIRVGETALAYYRATNHSSRRVVGTATYNVTPDKAGLFFDKIECFCTQEQVLEPGQSLDMPVAFYIAPEIAADANLDDVRDVTLSYTFFPAGTASADVETAARTN